MSIMSLCAILDGGRRKKEDRKSRKREATIIQDKNCEPAECLKKIVEGL